jgi:hypothetical protein
MRMLSRFAGLVVLIGLFIVPTVEARKRIYVTIAPPAAVVERVTVAPNPGWVWQPGYYQWNGTAYIWTPGAWVAPPYVKARWVEGHWVHSKRGYYWKAGHWAR